MINILLIEDNPADVMLFEEYVDGSELTGSAVVAVGTMRQAAQLVREQTFDVVVLDLSLPDCQREQTIIRAKSIFAKLPVVVLSGTNDLALAKTSVKEGIQDYLIKDSLDELSLARSINYAVERKRLINEKAAVEKNLVERNHYLEIANRRLEQFAYTVSHNLRAPLARILGLAQVVRHHPLGKEVSKLVTLIEQSANGLDASIRDLMDLLVVQKDMSKSATVVNIDHLLRSVTESLDTQIKAANAKITTDFSKMSCLLHPEPVLRSALMNLITNAVKYRSEQRPLHVHVALHPVQDWCCLLVRDNGMGMDIPAAGKQMFQLFARFHKHKPIPGKGIGLYMVKSLIEDCGGRIEVDSQVGVGTTFRIYLRRYTIAAEQPDKSLKTHSLLVPPDKFHNNGQVA